MAAVATASPAVGRAGPATIATPPAGDPLRLWYRQPARQWVEALPIGNGRLGAMVFGDPAADRLALNEDTFFAGSPYDATNPGAGAAMPRIRQLVFEDRWLDAQTLADQAVLGRPKGQMPYQPIGDLLIASPGLDGVADYLRTLDIDGAIATTAFRSGAVRHRREVIASAPDQVIAMRLSADGPAAAIAARLSFASQQSHEVTTEGGDTLVMRGIGPEAKGIPGGIRFEARVMVIPTGGTVAADGDGLAIAGAREAIVLLAIATSYRSYADISGDPAPEVRRRIAAAAAKGWPRLLADHQADHRALFRRMTLDLGRTDAADLPTDERVRRSKELDDPALAALYHQYGRYLLIASSRPGTQPANLQGIWNDKLHPAWDSKLTINVNTEMNYWPADMTGLGELTEPLLRLVRDLSETGRRTARNDWRARGWMIYNNTDIFRSTAMIDAAKWAIWPLGGAWLLSNLWDHWDYSRDPAFLAQLYPLMRGACDFYLDALVPHPRTGELVMSPSMSPENRHHEGVSICAGPAMDSQLLRDLFARTMEAAGRLGRDGDRRAELATALKRLPAERIGKAGQLQEWLEDWDMAAPEIHHRHVSHLYALYPGDQITLRDTPVLAAAARRSLEIRGDEATGWGIGWRINLWARLEQGDHAHRVVRMLLDPSRTYPNLFDAHPPFQIDGNFGGTAGITQMLVQSYRGTIHLLPALPAAWPNGAIRGVRVRGDARVDVEWRDGRLVRAVLTAGTAGRHTVRCGDVATQVALRRGVPMMLTLSGGMLVEQAA